MVLFRLFFHKRHPEYRKNKCFAVCFAIDFGSFHAFSKNNYSVVYNIMTVYYYCTTTCTVDREIFVVKIFSSTTFSDTAKYFVHISYYVYTC